MFEILLDVPAQKFLKKQILVLNHELSKRLKSLQTIRFHMIRKESWVMRKNYSESELGSFAFFTELIIQTTS